MANITMKYCALQYLNIWLSIDKKCCEDLNADDEDCKLGALKKIAFSYRVARNLPSKYDKGKRYKPVLDIIDNLAPTHFNDKNVTDVVANVENAISRKYGSRTVLSLTTKFLWIKFKSPIIIYDSRGKRALGLETKDFIDNTDFLKQYYEVWRIKYDRHATEIEAACDSLQNVLEYTQDIRIATAKYVKEVSDQQWFKERVFDIYLWNVGSPNEPFLSQE